MHCKYRTYHFIITVLIIIAISFCACKNNNVDTRYVFVLLPRTLTNDFHRSLVDGAKSETEHNAIYLETYAPISEDDYKYQERQIQAILLREDVDGVLITPNHSSALVPSLKYLDQRGIPFVLIDTPIDADIDTSAFKHYCGFVGTDNRYGGSLAADYIARELRRGDVLLIRGMETHKTSIDRELGFLETIGKYSDIKVVAIENGKWVRDSSRMIMKNMPRKVGAIFAYNDLMALGAADYFRGKKDRPIIVGFDGLTEGHL